MKEDDEREKLGMVAMKSERMINKIAGGNGEMERNKERESEIRREKWNESEKVEIGGRSDRGRLRK